MATLKRGLDEVEKVNEVTLILYPDGLSITAAGNYYALYKETMDQCAELKDRFAVMDVWMDADTTVDNIQVLRDADFGTIDTMKYGAVYYPRIFTRLDYNYTDENDSDHHWCG